MKIPVFTILSTKNFSFVAKLRLRIQACHLLTRPKMTIFHAHVHILGDPGADSGNEEKSKRAEKYGTKKSKERREEPLGTMFYQTSCKRSPPFWLLIGARKTQVKGETTPERSVFEKVRFPLRPFSPSTCGRQAKQEEKSPLSTKTDTCKRGFRIGKKFVPFHYGLFS